MVATDLGQKGGFRGSRTGNEGYNTLAEFKSDAPICYHQTAPCSVEASYLDRPLTVRPVNAHRLTVAGYRSAHHFPRDCGGRTEGSEFIERITANRFNV